MIWLIKLVIYFFALVAGGFAAHYLQRGDVQTTALLVTLGCLLTLCAILVHKKV